MYELKVLSQFSAAHRLLEFDGNCEHMHGHNWKVEVFVKGETLGNDGLLMDFRLVKAAANRVLERLDHKVLNDVAPFDRMNPSSENIARHVFESLREELDSDAATVSRVTVWESDTACATYEAS